MPSQSLIKKICHPEAYKFSTEATRYYYNALFKCILFNGNVDGVVSMKLVPFRSTQKMLKRIMRG